MKTIRLIALALTFLAFGANAQVHKQAIGIRGGLSSGFEYRVYTNEYNSYKLLLSSRDRGFQATGLKEFHELALFNESEQLVFFYGIGAHVGYERWDEYHYTSDVRYSNTKTSLIAGLDGLAGVEYNFLEVPISLGFEVKPFFNVLGRKTFDVQLFDFAFTLKYIF